MTGGGGRAAEIDGLLEEIRFSDVHKCGPVQDELNELDVKVPSPPPWRNLPRPAAP